MDYSKFYLNISSELLDKCCSLLPNYYSLASAQKVIIFQCWIFFGLKSNSVNY